MASSEIFEEVPIRIHNAPLARALLLEMQEKKVAVPVDFDRLDLTSSAFLEKKMQFLIEQVEDLASWQSSAHFWQRKLDQQMQQQLRAPLFEDKVVDYVFELAQVSDKEVSKADLEKAVEALDEE